ncbi:MAG: peroxiredoxin family protein [Actinobacteria bacterium]|nr:peroxiredoxin family protein [Actinomycetota bacterium]MBU1944395.1 peroxiredoxin family protein [Actinomycetota bacterium]MBU2688263.1 peroxiredoxin family protein [Actinomycetota bacterium]
MPRRRTKLHPGDMAPDFALEDASTGRTVTLEEFRGSPLVITFYRGTW